MVKKDTTKEISKDIKISDIEELVKVVHHFEVRDNGRIIKKTIMRKTLKRNYI